MEIKKIIFYFPTGPFFNGLTHQHLTSWQEQCLSEFRLLYVQTDEANFFSFDATAPSGPLSPHS